jgi:glycine cleavage system aminomethyltransferase T
LTLTIRGNRIKQTALFHTHRENGAKMSEHFGWQVLSSFLTPDAEAKQIRESVGLADISGISTFDLQGPGLKTPPDFGPEAFSWQLGRRQYLVTCDPAARDAVKERMRQFQKIAANPSLPPPIYVTEVTSVYTQLLLAGPRSREVLNKLTSLNLSESARGNLTCTQANVAHVHSIVLRKDMTAIPAFHLLVGREYGESVWQSVLHAGHEFHITPAGLEALRLLQG